MKRLLVLFTLIYFCFNGIIVSQSITGKLADVNGVGLPGLQLKLYSGVNSYNAVSENDGSFAFQGIVAVENNPGLPTGYSVSNNYPNPFNPRTRIYFTMPSEGNVSICIYNTLGQKVLDDFSSYYSSGLNHVDLELNGLANGVYLAYISLNEKYSTTKKLLLLYGSQHLNINSSSNIQLNKVTNFNASNMGAAFDSLVITGGAIKKNIFTNLPSLTGTTLDLGNVYVNTTTSGTPCLGVPTVLYSGKVYNTVLIGTQCWLKENLNIGTRINVSQYPSNNGTIEKYCYNDQESNCDTYGGLYWWNEAMAYSTTPGTKGICPDGFHIPTYSDLHTLATTVGNNSNALKAMGQGTNTSGFSALLAGYRSYGSGNFFNLGSNAYFWSSTEDGSNYAYDMNLNKNNSSIYFYGHFNRTYGFSVRCVKD